ncbi:hypothetical protein MANES_17G078950v8 [Manihot esculenta]|uniref:Uncharacterized protein n=1 Tax=Manihot esculenta TaxID=3983 RepID=A0ACB7G4F0_MANES|nr:hypothetical protein MANES_17G078950v8 [Manihot esculenta]
MKVIKMRLFFLLYRGVCLLRLLPRQTLLMLITQVFCRLNVKPHRSNSLPQLCLLRWCCSPHLHPQFCSKQQLISLLFSPQFCHMLLFQCQRMFRRLVRQF